MRGYFVYYLKILWAICVVHESAANAMRISRNDAYKKLLSLRSLPFEDCGSSSLYHVNYLNIESCTKVPCSMARDSTVKVTVLFDDNGNGVSFLKHEVRWVFTYVKTEAAISPDPCDGDHNCILNVNDSKSYWANIYVNPTLPVMKGSMLWEAKDEKNQNLICFEVPVVITT
ncbi:NPC intracellular cholesterol transporter 2 isoform X2 [Drosophila novamexicana]|uniref:NPC intracellular cholesterol transporter 2 isoform X2 n=1 Tax=Drosophila novamexicana TaxID=47314 RepID=UPI0011E59048|nr:NPC intracellular cholesterol transporter 2 isoform X2 [Drosophila novamexicana]